MISVEIVTPQKVSWTGEAEGLQAPGELGEFGVLEKHISFLTTLRPGLVTVKSKEGPRRFVVGSGFAEVGATHVVLLTELCEELSSVDKDAARKALADAEATLKSAAWGSLEQLQAERSIALNRARLSA